MRKGTVTRQRHLDLHLLAASSLLPGDAAPWQLMCLAKGRWAGVNPALPPSWVSAKYSNRTGQTTRRWHLCIKQKEFLLPSRSSPCWAFVTPSAGRLCITHKLCDLTCRSLETLSHGLTSFWESLNRSLCPPPIGFPHSKDSFWSSYLTSPLKEHYLSKSIRKAGQDSFSIPAPPKEQV